MTGLLTRLARIGRFGRSTRGATAVKFAIVAPVFIMLVTGTIELSRVMWIKATMQFAAEETSRYALVNTSASTDTLVTYATNVVSSYGVDTTDMTFDVTSSASTISVQITYTFYSLVPLVAIPDIELSAKSQVPLSAS